MYRRSNPHNNSSDNGVLVMPETSSYSEEFVNATKNDTCSEMFSRMMDEARDAETYIELASAAEIMGNQSLAKTFTEIAYNEIKHFELLSREIENMYGNLKENVLYPLLVNLENIVDSIRSDAQDM